MPKPLVRSWRYRAAALLTGWALFSVGVAAAADPTLAVQSVSFNGLDVVNDTVGGPNPFPLVAKPQWSGGTQTGPVAYVSGTRVSVDVTFAITNPPAANTKVFVTGSNSTVGERTGEGTITAGQATLTMGFPFPNAFAASQTEFFDSNFQIAWTYRLKNAGAPPSAGTTTHTLYVTLAAPVAGTKIYRTSLKLAIPAGGDRTADSVFDRTWGSFSGPANVTNWNGNPLYYYRPPPGGGGFGDPSTREPERVVRDVRLGYISPEAACRDYKVVLRPDGSLDADATARARAGTPA